MKQKHFYKFVAPLLASILFASGTVLYSCSDNDLGSNQRDGDRGASVVFNIKDIQQDNIAKAATRAGIPPTLPYTPDLTQEDLAPHRLEAISSDGLDACLIETTVEGINPTKPDPVTRAKVETSIEHDFTTLGYRGETANTISDKPKWFYNKKTKKNGELYETHFWSWDKPYGRFYAIYPEVKAENKITLSPATHQGTPYIDFEVEEDVADQHDLMTACSGVVHYVIQNTAPQTNLEFRHALTAVKFAVGENLSWGAIDYIEIRNALSKGRYNLSDKLDGTGAGWDATTLDAPKTFTLTPTPVISTKKNPGVIITGTSNDEYTFYMIPQTLTGKGIEAYVHFTDGKTISATLKGEWKAGTTKTYKLSNTTSNWNYVLNIENPSVAAYNTTTTDKYKITSFRQAPDGTKHPVKWEVVGYDANDDGTFDMSEKPDWLTLSKTTGDGGTAADQGTATLTTSIVDSVAIINDALKKHPLGTSGNPYDLSTNGSTDLSKRNTANCYLISHPGYYKIPLVYGNAIKNGNTNTSSYISTAPATIVEGSDVVLHNFKDHNEQDITDPWITKTNGGINVPTGAKLIWADESGLVTSYMVIGSGDQAYLRFRVPPTIKAGNAVLAIVNASGTVLWSWHLWFTPGNVLDKIEVTNHQNVKYNFTSANLGWKYTKYDVTSFGEKRSVKVKVRQTIANGGTKKDAIITITQKGHREREGYNTFYEFGRKDAFPGTNSLAQGSAFQWTNGDGTIKSGIQNPDKMYNTAIKKNGNIICYNLWSMQNTIAVDINAGVDYPVVKTVYDPSPAGFKLPPSNAFTGFTTTGQEVTSVFQMNMDGDVSSYTAFIAYLENNYGYNFYTNSSKKKTIYFPISGIREGIYGSLKYQKNGSICWAATPARAFGSELGYYGAGFAFAHNHVTPVRSNEIPSGYAVRPVADN